MGELFANYVPQAWFDEAGLRKTSRTRGATATAIKRMRRWKNSVRGVSFPIAMSAALALTSMSFSQSVSANNALDLPVPPQMLAVAPAPGADASLGEINESFTQLFAAFRSGTKLITNARTRELATKAAARRNDRPEGWAHKLASDVGDAND